jgi:nicotinic acid phosphoribosyltransferase
MSIYNNNDYICPLLTDLYQVRLCIDSYINVTFNVYFYIRLIKITMAYGYWKSGRTEHHAVFDLFFRKNPFNGEFCIFAGLGEVLEFVENFK